MKILVILCVAYVSRLCSCESLDDIIARFDGEVAKTQKFLEDAKSTLKGAENALEEYTKACTEIQNSKKVEAESARKAFEAAQKTLGKVPGSDAVLQALKKALEDLDKGAKFEPPSVESQGKVVKEALEKVADIHDLLNTVKPLEKLDEGNHEQQSSGTTPIDAKPGLVEQTTVSTSGNFCGSDISLHEHADVPPKASPEEHKVVTGNTTFTEPKEVTEDNPNKPSGDNAAGQVTDPQESWDTKSESSTNDPSYQSSTEESVLVGSDKNEETATEHEDIPHQSFSSHSEEQLQTGEHTAQSEELPESSRHVNEVATVEHNEEDTDTNEFKPLNDSESQPLALPSGPITLDISEIDQSIFPSFEYHQDDTLIRLITVHDGVNVTSVVNGNEEVWNSKNGEVFLYSQVYPKDDKLALILVVVNASSGMDYLFYKFDKNKWKRVWDHTKIIEKLNAKTDSTTHISIDIEKLDETDECRIFEAKMIDTPGRFYIPKLGFKAKEIKEGGLNIWRLAEGSNDVCISCELYSKDGREPIVRMTLKIKKELDYKYFEKQESGWVPITWPEFFKKRKSMKGSEESSTSASETSKEQSSSSNQNLHKLEGVNSQNSPGQKSLGRRGSIESLNSIGSAHSLVSAGSASENSRASTLDLSNLNDSFCRYFYYTYNENPTVLVTPFADVPIKKLVNEKKTVWTAKSGETFEYAKLYLKDKKPDVILVTKRCSSGINYTYYSRGKFLGWSECTNYNDKIAMLRVPSPRKDDFVINLEEEKDTDECTTFEANLLGVSPRFYFPNPGYCAKEVKHSDTLIWQGTDNERCLSCDLYSKKNEPLIVLLTVASSGGSEHQYFGKDGNEWRSINKEEFYANVNELTTGSA